MQTASTRLPTPMLFVAFELGNTEWKLACTSDLERAPMIRSLAARDLSTLLREFAGTKQRLGLPPEVPIASCYEAGRDGFWLHRWLTTQGVLSSVVDSSSIEVNRRRRRAKTDRLDAAKLVTMLIRARSGERRVWSVVHVPAELAEDQRHVHRALLTARRDRARHTNRIKGLLAAVGMPLTRLSELPDHLRVARDWAGQPVPPRLRARLEREWALVLAHHAQIRDLRRERRRLLQTTDDPAIAQVQQLYRLRGIGLDSAWLYVMEFFAWRHFTNRRQVGGLAGLTDTPFRSGDVEHQQGISKAGNRWVRTLAINTAWAWLRYQPQSALAQWYERRFGQGSARVRKIGIVALARKLLIALWRYLDTGVVPEGAMLRS